jgi:hypothetical protein
LVPVVLECALPLKQVLTQAPQLSQNFFQPALTPVQLRVEWQQR